MLQIVYVSSANPAKPCAIKDILHVSRRNNARDRISGVLFADSGQFLQALEGPEDLVERAFQRIAADDRHHSIVTLSRRTIHRCEFGHWEMAHRAPGANAAQFLEQVRALIEDAHPEIQSIFDGRILAREGV